MEKTEKKLLDVVALSSIVIALSSLGSMAVAILTLHGTILPVAFTTALLRIIGWASFGFVVWAMVKYFHR